MAFQNAQQNNSDQNGFMQMLIKALGTGAGALLGGPAGAAIGGGIGGLAGPTSGSPYHPWNNPG
jgi:outer membrane lipoprotein SlyB